MWLILFSCLVVIVVAIFQYLQTRSKIFQRLNLPGPKPKLIWGNLEAFKGRIDSSHILRDWTKQYGKTYGFMEGGNPIIVTSDVDILQEVFIKQFSNFHGRKFFAMHPNPDTAPNINLFDARGARWKRLRNISNPTFTSIKLKNMLPIIVECVNETISVLDQQHKAGKPFDIHRVYQGLTLDVIAQTAFGYQTSVQRNPDDPLMDICRGVFRFQRGPLGRFIFISSLLFPEVLDFWRFLAFKSAPIRKQHPAQVLRERMKKVVEERKKQKESKDGVKDFIQLMLEAETSEDFVNEIKQDTEMKAPTVEKKLTIDEIASQSFVFMLAGFETTSTVLGYTTYLLAIHPEVQERLIEEIDEKVEELNYDTIKKLNYLDMVVRESLRMYPIGEPVVSRQCMTNCNAGDLYIPKGVYVMADVLSIHFNEEYWGSDAQEFNPERFSEDNSKGRPPLAFLPFGAGPRTCIGMRFGILETKLALCKILQKFKFRSCPETEEYVPIGGMPPINGVVVLLESRK